MHFPAKAAGTKARFDQRWFHSKRFYHAIYQVFALGNGGEPGCSFDVMGLTLDGVGDLLGRHRRRCRGSLSGNRSGKELPPKHGMLVDYPGGDGTARGGIRKPVRVEVGDPRKDRSAAASGRGSFVGRSGLGRERTVGTSLSGAARGICDDGRGVMVRPMPTTWALPCWAAWC